MKEFKEVLSNAPWYVRWTFYFVGFIVSSYFWTFSQGWNTKHKTDAYFTAIADSSFDRKAAPFVSLRNEQLGAIHRRLNGLENELKTHNKALGRIEGSLEILVQRTKH